MRYYVYNHHGFWQYPMGGSSLLEADVVFLWSDWAFPKHFSKFDKFDYFWPEFQHIGEQEILNKEILANHVAPDDVFGYIPRYAEYKYNPSTVHGDFKKTLDFWHLGRIFNPNNPPYLNQNFIECKPSRRIFAVEESEEDTLYCHMFHKITAERRTAYFSDPSFR